MNYINILKRNETQHIRVGIDNQLFKIIKVGKEDRSVVVKWFGHTPGIKYGGWNTTVWYLDHLDATGKKVIDLVVAQVVEENRARNKKRQGQTVLV